jgi:FtsP/CotA-like multicopper oxidase with cupredoxin domain
VPGPLIRVPVGTAVHTTVRNELGDTLLVVGLSGPMGRGEDTLRVPPGGTDSIVAQPAPPGTYAYMGATRAGGAIVDGGPGEQLFGAFVIDSANAAPDRILVIKAWNGPDTAGTKEPFVMAINGKSWPHTERFRLSIGDTLRLRMINGANSEHPMHLHGFFYRVDAVGTWTGDSVLPVADRRMVVTHTMRERETVSLSWAPARPGNWLFHCHDAFHIQGEQHHDLARAPRPDHGQMGTAQEHLRQGMAGLVMGIEVAGIEGPIDTVVRARHRIVVDQFPGAMPDGSDIFAYALDRPGAAPSAEVPAAPLELVRGRRAAVTVVNRLPVATAVHWHGLEIESYYDGVAGWSGSGSRLAPMIAPGDSFVALLTPPRAGTYIYHSHLDDARQLTQGLIGPLLVMEPGARRDPARDHVWLFHVAGSSDSAAVVLNGGRPLRGLTAGVRHRIRLVVITAGDPVDLELRQGDDVVEWRALAKDGADLPVGQRRSLPARLHLGPGETADFEWTPRAGQHRIVVRSFNDFEVPLVVR